MPSGDNAVAGGQPAIDHPIVADAVAGHNRPRLHLVAGSHHVHGFQSLQFLHGLLRYADRARIFECRDGDAHEQTRTQEAIGVRHRDAQLHRSALFGSTVASTKLSLPASL